MTYDPHGPTTPGGATQGSPALGPVSHGAPAAAEPRAPAIDPVHEEMDLLRSIRDSLKASPVSVGITGESTPPALEPDFLSPGYHRLLIPRQPSGGEIATEAAKYVKLVPANHNRVGGSVVNHGEAPVLLRLATPERVEATGGRAIGSLWLGKGGGSWDFRLGPLLWLGVVSAISEGGASVCSVVEL